MKLIDADKLKTNLWDLYCHYACNGRDLNKAADLNVGLGAIEVQEEVEAIPISWIEEWCKYLRENIKNVSYKNLNVYREVYEDYLKMERFLSGMIEDWRRENED